MQQSKVATGADFRMSPRLPFDSFETHAFGPSTLACDCGVLMGLGMSFALSVPRTSFGAGLTLPNAPLAYTARLQQTGDLAWPLLTEPSSSVWSRGRDSYLLVSF